MDDLISRQDAIEAIASRDETNGTVKVFTGRQVNEILASLPSAQPKTGHWVLVNRGLDIYMCDQCGEILQIDRVPIWDYCPVCGARMGGETDGRPNK